jgi:hypothetical protein
VVEKSLRVLQALVVVIDIAQEKNIALALIGELVMVVDPCLVDALAMHQQFAPEAGVPEVAVKQTQGLIRFSANWLWQG